MNLKKEVESTLEEYAKQYCAKNVDCLMDLFEDNDDISLIGTGAEELCSGRKAIREVFVRNFLEASATSFDWHWIHTIVADSDAVMAVSLSINLDTNGEPVTIPIRWTVALRKRAGMWKWIHRHASTPAISQDEGRAYPTK